MPAHSGVWVGTLAKVLEKFGSRHRALWKANPLALPREQEFFKGCNYRAAERRQPADPTLPGRRPGLSPRGLRGVCRAACEPLRCPGDTQPPSGQPQGQQRCPRRLCRCKSPGSSRKQWIWTCSCPGFLLNGHFPPRCLSFQVQSFSSILRILRQLETQRVENP